MSDTAPFIVPIISSQQEPQIRNLDFEKINLFNTRIELCSRCDRCTENNNIAFCSELNIPLSVAADKDSCPIGKW